MTLLAVIASTLTFAAQDVAAIPPVGELGGPPVGFHHHHHRRHHRRRLRYQTAIASYYDYGRASTGACGTLQANGVANKYLPCGTRLVMCARRCVTAVVDDRGPYVYGRDFDLSVSLAQMMGFPMTAGVAPVRWRAD